MKPEKEKNQFITNLLKAGLVSVIPVLTRLFSPSTWNSEKTKKSLKEIFQTTSSQVREKAEETKKAVKLRMAVLEIEHHLNRLYPQIGKITCDLTQQGKKMLLNDEELKSKTELAAEYRARLMELKTEQDSHQMKSRKKT